MILDCKCSHCDRVTVGVPGSVCKDCAKDLYGCLDEFTCIRCDAPVTKSESLCPSCSEYLADSW